jgi:DNA-binding CsgD family transcriptional regulator
MVPVLARVHGAQDRPLLEQLGERDFQSLLLTGQGHSVDDCARLLNLSDKTVRNYLTQIKAKMNAANTAELVRMAIRAGLVEPEVVVLDPADQPALAGHHPNP